MSEETLKVVPGSGIGRRKRRHLTRPPASGHRRPAKMVRDLSGSINSWDTSSVSVYGFSRQQALGNISHHLLKTVFPCPLSEINEILLQQNFWEGELIHTARDGDRVKVLSRWELIRDQTDGAFRVREINQGFVPIDPEAAQLVVPTFSNRPWARFYRKVQRHLKWYLIPAIIVIVAFILVAIFTQDTPLPVRAL